jgi:hypothetical protein
MVVLLHLDLKKISEEGGRERERERDLVLVITFITQLVACSLFFESSTGVS